MTAGEATDPGRRQTWGPQTSAKDSVIQVLRGTKGLDSEKNKNNMYLLKASF